MLIFSCFLKNAVTIFAGGTILDKQNHGSYRDSHFYIQMKTVF